jgi:hypothetical protein
MIHRQGIDGRLCLRRVVVPEYSHTPVVTSLCLLELRCAYVIVLIIINWHHGECLVDVDRGRPVLRLRAPPRRLQPV